MSSIVEIQIIAILISISCGIIGTFLVFKNMSMMADAITHTILLGIVISYFIVTDLNSPILIIGASLVGIITVWITQVLADTKLLGNDSAIGLVFPFLFSIAIILISKYSSNTHLDTDSVLLGEIAFAPFNRLIIFGIDIGAKAIYTSSLILIINIIYIKIFFKELKLTIFDPILAITIGLSPALIHYSLMTLVSITCVVAFDAVGSILVIAFMITPATTAYLLSHNLKTILILSSIISTISAVLGLQLALFFDISISGSMAIVVGLLFIMTFVYSCLKKIKSNSKLNIKN